MTTDTKTKEDIDIVDDDLDQISAAEPDTSSEVGDEVTEEPQVDDDGREYASWTRQAGAYCIDLVLPVIALVALVLIVDVTSAALWADIVCGGLGVAIVGGVIWNIVVRQGLTGNTLGKSATCISTENVNGESRIGVMRAGARQVAHVIDTVPLLVGWLLPLRDPKRRTLADRIAGTRVVKHDGPPASRVVWSSVAVMAAAAVAVAGLVAVQYFDQHRQDQAVAEAHQDIAEIAQASTIALLSYQPDTVDADLQSAAGRLTGGFLDYYSKYTKEVVIPAAKEKKVDTQAEAVGSGVVSADADRATVLVFINQTTTTVDNPQPSKVASTVQVSLVKVDGRWLVDEFKPI